LNKKSLLLHPQFPAGFSQSYQASWSPSKKCEQWQVQPVKKFSSSSLRNTLSTNTIRNTLIHNKYNILTIEESDNVSNHKETKPKKRIKFKTKRGFNKKNLHMKSTGSENLKKIPQMEQGLLEGN
jgi:hypothetical protein